MIKISENSTGQVIARSMKKVPATMGGTCGKDSDTDGNNTFPVCYVVSSLKPNTFYFFEIQASVWSFLKNFS